LEMCRLENWAISFLIILFSNFQIESNIFSFFL